MYRTPPNLIKVRSPHDEYLNQLLYNQKNGKLTVVKVDNSGSAKYLGRVAHQTGSISIVKQRPNDTLLILTGDLKKREKVRNGTYYEFERGII